MLLLAFAALAGSPGVAVGETTTDEPKDHLLFIGLDVSLPGEGGPGLVQDISRGQARILVNGEVQTIRLYGLRNVGMSSEPKVSNVILAMSEPVGRKTFTPSREPGRTILDQQTNVAFVQDARMAAAESAVAQVVLAPTFSELDAVRLSGASAAAAQQMDATIAASMGEAFDPGSVQQRAERTAGNGVHDAYEVTFTLSAPGTITDAFAVMILDVLSVASPQRPTQSVIFRPLPTITTEPRKVSIEQRGLPEGFAIDRVRIHVYAHGREFGTSRSDRSVALTRAEAHQFLVLQYLLAHKQESRPPAPVPDFLPSELSEVLPANAHDHAVAVTVNRDGEVEGVELHGNLPAGVTTRVADLIRGTRFYPALLNGEPTSSEGSFLLREFLAGETTAAALPFSGSPLK